MSAKPLVAFLLVTIAQGVTAAPQPIFGIAQAQDGDSLTINGTRIRLFGIDAPEFDQTCTRGQTKWACGAESADHLSKLVTGREVRCSQLGKDQFGRILGRCTVGGFEVNRIVVERGWATAFRKYSTDYVASENRAKDAGLGIWAGAFQVPSEVRTEKRGMRSMTKGRQSTPRPQMQSLNSTPTGCRIKGNHSRKGEWIYHLPGMPYYEQTRPEAMFCTEAEARAAGYRRARTPR